ncbi:hypothetical protein A9K55_000370 [Cordyceps militaris]|uniref:Uncharacterized protein n=1 Tax=Cordyceps militaris TaxID=73501 RepID=A0A2H4SVP7_CORMI|nr:hypothetical protein A9K55_000370 [Cordyceps militaris]
MSRVAAPVAKLSRAISSTAAPAAVSRSSGSLLDSSAHHGGAPLMPKYAELLRDREQNKSRGITTTHRPTPQPSIADRPRPLMQTFHSSASRVAVPATHLDAMILPSLNFAAAEPASAGPRVPLLPDNYGAAHAPAPPVPEAAFSKPTIFAAEPDRVAPATPLSAVEGLTLDGIELKFAHDGPTPETEHGGHMIRDLWKGMVHDVLGPAPKTL